jgi:hypothetical protein
MNTDNTNTNTETDDANPAVQKFMRKVFNHYAKKELSNEPTPSSKETRKSALKEKYRDEEEYRNKVDFCFIELTTRKGHGINFKWPKENGAGNGYLSGRSKDGAIPGDGTSKELLHSLKKQDEKSPLTAESWNKDFDGFIKALEEGLHNSYKEWKKRAKETSAPSGTTPQTSDASAPPCQIPNQEVLKDKIAEKQQTNHYNESTTTTMSTENTDSNNPNPVSKEQIEELSKFHTSSFAIWSDNFGEDNCLENQTGQGQPKKFFEENSGKSGVLKSNIILLALNKSGKADDEKIAEEMKKSPMRNFHYFGEGDLYLSKTIKNYKKICGAFMTDISGIIETNSQKVEIAEKDFEEFVKKLNILKSDNFQVICFSKGKVFEPIFKFFKNKKIKVTKKSTAYKDCKVEEFSIDYEGKHIRFYGVLHYSSLFNGWANHRKGEFEHQLEYINNEITNTSHTS